MQLVSSETQRTFTWLGHSSQSNKNALLRTTWTELWDQKGQNMAEDINSENRDDGH